jgi:DNA repair exonuclease SbcCD ATPase subunit
LSLEDELSNISYDPETCRESQDQLDSLIANRELVSLRSLHNAEVAKLKKMKSDDSKEKEEAIVSINSKLWVDYSREALEQSIEQERETADGKKRLAILDKKLLQNTVSLETYEKNLSELEIKKRVIIDKRKLFADLEFQATTYRCPSCKIDICFVGGTCRRSRPQKEQHDPEELEDEIETIQTEITTLERSIQDAISKLSKCAEYQQEIDSLQEFRDKPTNHSVSDLNRLLQENLTLEEDKRRLTSQSVSSSIRTVEISVEALRKKLNTKEKTVPSLNYSRGESELRSIIAEQEKIKRMVESHTKSKAMRNKEKDTLERQIKKLQSEHIATFGKLRLLSTLRPELETLRESLPGLLKQHDTHTANLKLLESHTKRKAMLNKEKETLERQIKKLKSDHIATFGELRIADSIRTTPDELRSSLFALRTELETLIKSLPDLLKQHETHTTNLKLLETFTNYEANKKRYDVQKVKETTLLTELEIVRKKHTASLRLKTKILEAESLALENIIDSINNNAKVYLNAFFPDDPITVNLLAFKELKSKKADKPSINIQIEYKGIESDTTMLSGGELCRVTLAFTLALGEIFNTKFLMLDESTASLNQELTREVFDAIKENFGGRLVLVIGHQIVTGMFDTVINL